MTPLDRVGVYVPGGKAAYPSSVLMNAIPAHVAGVAEIVMVVPTPGGARNPLVLAAAHLAGVTRAFAIGGAQAIAALAYGTATIPAVDKICGPGNAYVAAAKRRVFGTVGIDMVAGASEVLVIADAHRESRLGRDGPLRAGRARRAARRRSCVTPDAALHRRGRARARSGRSRRCRGARSSPASLARRGALDPGARPRRGLRDREPHRARASRARRRRPGGAAAEDPPRRRDLHAGTHASEALGDYCAGPNHVLPTGRTARFSSPLGVYDFQKRSSVLKLSPRRARARSARSPRTLARGEGLPAHAQSALYRSRA